jgi:Tol biopolymer transport system component
MRTDVLPINTRGWRVSIVSLILALLVGGACASSDPVDEPIEQGPRPNGAIVFIAGSLSDYGPVQVYSMQQDGSQLRQLTDGISYKTALATSPDGSRIAYAASDRELTEESPALEPSSIFVMEADGSGSRELCESCARTAYVFEPEDTGFEGIWYDTSPDAVPNSLAWSPTGSTLAVPGVAPGVILIDVETGQMTTIATPEPTTAITWSPDGRRLAVSHTWFQPEMIVPREGTLLGDQYDVRPGGIYLVEVATGDVDEVISTPGMAHVHGWSPDGDLIAYTQHPGTLEGNEVSMYSVSKDTSWSIVPGKRYQWGLGGSWSPAGGRIATLVEQGGEDNRTALDLFIASADGSDLRGLPLCRFQGAFDGDNCLRGTFVWSPDGTMLAYRAMLHGTPVRSAVILQAVDSSSTDVLLLDGVSFDIGEGPCCLAWLPAS